MTSKSSYFGTYTTLKHTDDTTEIKLDGNYCVIGRELDFIAELRVTSRGKERPRVTIALNDKMAAGFLEPELAERILKLNNDGWDIHICPSLVIFNRPKNLYTCEVAILAFLPEQREIFEPFAIKIFERIAHGEHPQINLTNKQLERVVESKGAWCKTDELPISKLPKGSAVYKDQMTATERMAKQAAKRPVGCYIGLVVVAVLIIAIVFYLFFG